MAKTRTSFHKPEISFKSLLVQAPWRSCTVLTHLLPLCWVGMRTSMGHGCISVLWLNKVKQVSQKVSVQPSLSFCFASLWAQKSTSQLSWLKASMAAVSVTQQLKASGFPKAGSGIPPLSVNTSIILQVDWLAHWIRHENEGGRPDE